MSLDWMSGPIQCDGNIVYSGINPDQPLLPLRTPIIFRATLLYNSWQAHACDGRQMNYEDFDRMDEFEGRFWDESLDEESFRRLINEFGDFLPEFVTNGKAIVPERAVIWTQEEMQRRTKQA
jgi:hypothetical protein